MPDPILTHTHGDIVLVTLNRAEARNAVNFEVMDALDALLPRLNADPSVRGVVLTGAGTQAFSAGMDVKIAAKFDAEAASRWMKRTKIFFSTLRNFDKPLVAAVNGVAAGLGYQIALLCDVRIGHEGARMGQPEINVGLASVIGAHLMCLSLGHSRTVELTLSGRLMDGAECQAVGLLHRLVEADQVIPQALDLAHALGQKPANAMRLTKQRFREVTQAAFDATFEAGARLQAEAYASGEPQSVMAAFIAARGKR
ncbi:MAG: enoyl-CoA hydratase/isomerase family protein [Alphaproteobacteria bacterium]|nr:enoyl-CoA hydratase/isomerase family protein [Alphaproteobacteria bacterium]